ncbi:MAG TPA: cytochrome c biogenesis protein CcsA, partial [Syntrophales bacterium]
MITSSILLSITTFAYLLCALLYLAGVIFHRRTIMLWGSVTGAVTLAIQMAGILLRWRESYQIGYGHAPLSNLYESLVFAAWAIMLIYLIMEYRTKQRALGVFPALFAFLAMAYASFSTGVSSKIQPLLPALKSNWLIAHVVTCFLGYAAFAVSCGISILYTVRNSKPETSGGASSLLPDLRQLDEINYQMVLFGFLWLSL